MTVAAFSSAGQHWRSLCDPSAREWIALATRLRHRVRAVKQKDRDFLVWLLADIHRPMDAGARLLPFDLTRRDLNVLALAAVTVFNGKDIACQHHCDSIEGIAISRQSLAASKAQTAHHRGSMLEENFVHHDCTAALFLRDTDIVLALPSSP